MILPTPKPSDVLADVPYVPLVEDARARKALDKALIDKAVTIRLVQELPELLDNSLRLATSADSESVQLDATKYIIDRIAGKPVERTQSQSLSVQVIVSADEVQERLKNLLV